jgi:hypothetical protein
LGKEHSICVKTMFFNFNPEVLRINKKINQTWSNQKVLQILSCFWSNEQKDFLSSLFVTFINSRVYERIVLNSKICFFLLRYRVKVS